MADPVETQPRRRRRGAAAGWIGTTGAALLPVLACFLGGGTQKWAEGIAVAALGFLLLVQPPRLSLGWAINSVLVSFVALAALSFAPAHWFFVPEWRAIMTADFGMQLSDTVSPQPWITGSCLVSLVAGICWLYFVATQETDFRRVRAQMRLFAIGIVFLAGLAILLFYLRSPLTFWINQRSFGPFPNRNQTGNLFGISAIVALACGQDELRQGRKGWILWLIGLALLTTAVILNLSRAGMAILVGGCMLWIAVVALRQRSTPAMALAFSFCLILLAAMLLLGGQTLERFHLRGLGGPGITTDFRWKIFHDTFAMIRQSPWCGIGLGNFDPIFALFRDESATATRALHPESDWLWLWSEMGWPAVVLAVTGMILLLRHVLPLQEGTNQRFRLAAMLGALIFALHGLMDVSAHRVGTAYAGIFLLGVCLHRPLSFPPNRALPVLFRLLGIGLIIAGLSWTFATKNSALLPGPVGVTNVKHLAPMATRGLNFAEAIALNEKALEWAPLDWQLYFSRALAEVGARLPEKALDDFRRARYLEPDTFAVPLAEGSAWLNTQPIYAATAWREALQRTATGQQRLEVYAGMLNKAAIENKEVGRILAEVGLSQHDLVLAYLNKVDGNLFSQELERFLVNDPELRTLTDTEKLALFTLWADRGNLENLASQIERHPDWLPFAWLGLAKYKASKNDYQGGYELTQRFGEAVAMPRGLLEAGSIDDLQKRYFSNPDNFAVGYTLYREQLKAGRPDDALVTLRHFTERPNVPPYFHYLEAQAWASKQNWERAWAAWVNYQKASRK